MYGGLVKEWGKKVVCFDTKSMRYQANGCRGQVRAAGLSSGAGCSWISLRDRGGASTYHRKQQVARSPSCGAGAHNFDWSVIIPLALDWNNRTLAQSTLARCLSLAIFRGGSAAAGPMVQMDDVFGPYRGTEPWFHLVG